MRRRGCATLSRMLPPSRHRRRRCTVATSSGTRPHSMRVLSSETHCRPHVRLSVDERFQHPPRGSPATQDAADPGPRAGRRARLWSAWDPPSDDGRGTVGVEERDRLGAGSGDSEGDTQVEVDEQVRPRSSQVQKSLEGAVGVMFARVEHGEAGDGAHRSPPCSANWHVTARALHAQRAAARTRLAARRTATVRARRPARRWR